MALSAWTFDDGENRPTTPIGAFTYRETYRTSGTGQLGSNSSATRVFLVDWTYHTNFINDLIGYSLYTGGSNLERILPDVHPDYNYYYCTDATVKPCGKGSVAQNKSVWDIAEVTATYKPVPYAVRSDGAIEMELDRYVSRMPKASAQYATANNMGMKFVYNQESLQFSPGVLIPEASVVYKWHQVPAVIDALDPNSEYRIPYIDELLGYLGKCNSTTFDTVYAPGTMLLVEIGGEMVMQQLQDGLYYWNIEYGFINKNFGESLDETGDPMPHAGVNYVYDFKNGSYRLVTTDGTTGGTRLYGKADMNELFTV